MISNLLIRTQLLVILLLTFCSESGVHTLADNLFTDFISSDGVAVSFGHTRTWYFFFLSKSKVIN